MSPAVPSRPCHRNWYLAALRHRRSPIANAVYLRSRQDGLLMNLLAEDLAD